MAGRGNEVMSTQQRRVRLGQIGIGHNHAQGNLASLRKVTDLFEIVGVVESDPQWKKQRGGISRPTDMPAIYSKSQMSSNPEPRVWMIRGQAGVKIMKFWQLQIPAKISLWQSCNMAKECIS